MDSSKNPAAESVVKIDSPNGDKCHIEGEPTAVKFLNSFLLRRKIRLLPSEEAQMRNFYRRGEMAAEEGLRGATGTVKDLLPASFSHPISLDQ